MKLSENVRLHARDPEEYYLKKIMPKWADRIEELEAENKRLLDIQGLLISWMKRHKTDTSYPHKPTQQTYWEQIVSDYPYLAEVDDELR